MPSDADETQDSAEPVDSAEGSDDKQDGSDDKQNVSDDKQDDSPNEPGNGLPPSKKTASQRERSRRQEKARRLRKKLIKVGKYKNYIILDIPPAQDLVNVAFIEIHYSNSLVSDCHSGKSVMML